MFPKIFKGRERVVKNVKGIFYNIVKKRLQSGKKVDDGLQIIIDYRNITIDNIDSESMSQDLDMLAFDVFSLLFAAQTNTAVIAAWTILHIITNPQWSQAVMEEQKQIFAKTNNEMSATAVGQMTVLDKCMKETMRITLHAPTWRRIMQDNVKFKQYEIPKGCYVTTTMNQTHMDDTLYQNPTQWDPNRWCKPEKSETNYQSEENDSKKQKQKQDHSFVGFGSGQHPCLGMKMSQYEIRILVSLALQKYKFELMDQKFPEVNRNNIHGSWPKTKVAVRYSLNNSV